MLAMALSSWRSWTELNPGTRLVLDVAREPIEAMDDQRVAFADVPQRGTQLRPLSVPAAHLIRKDLATATKCSTLWSASNAVLSAN